MLIQCEKCSTRYNLDEAKIPGKGAKVTCPSCKHVFIVMKGQGAAAPAGGPPPAAPAAPSAPAQPPPGKSLLDNFFDDSKTVPGTPFGGAPMGAVNVAPGGRNIRSWKVRVGSGLVYDFTDVSTLKAWIAEKKVTTGDQISSDGSNWTVIGSIPNLDAFFGGGAPTSSPMGAPGPAPATGFGPSPGGPAAPAFSSGAPSASGSLADLFNSPAPDATTDPFAGSPPPSNGGANPFGGQPPGNPFGGPGAPPPATPAATNPFGADPFAKPSPGASPFGGGADPFGPSPSAPPPAASAPTNPFGPDPFAASGAPANPFGGSDPFGGAPAGDVAAPPPPMLGPKPAPPPWLSGPAPAPAAANVAPPPTPASAPGAATSSTFMPPQAPPQVADDIPLVPTKRPTSWMGPASKPVGAVTAITKPKRRIGRMLGLTVVVLGVVAIGGGLAMNFERIRTALAPLPTPVPTSTPPPIVLALEGEAQAHYLKGRRFLRLDTPDAYAKAEEQFRAALEKANANPRAAAGVLEALALQKQAGVAVPDDELQSAHAAANSAFKEDPQGLETNRALAQLDAITGKPADALGRLETALATRPGDAEALFLRSRLRAADPAQTKAAVEDLTAAAAADPTLTRAIAQKAQGVKPKSPEKKALDALTAENAATLAALTGGTWAWTPDEFGRLLPGVPLPAPSVAPAVSPVATEVAVPSPVASVEPSATPTAIVATPTAGQTPIASASPGKTPKPVKSPVAAASPTATRTPLGMGTAEPSATEPEWGNPDGTVVATASAQDHFLAGQAYEQAASWEDAISEFKEAVKLNPKSSQYKLALGGAMLRAGKLQDAADILTEVTEADPNNASAHRLLGLLFDATGQSANACGEFQEYLRLKPTAPDGGDIRTRMLRHGC